MPFKNFLNDLLWELYPYFFFFMYFRVAFLNLGTAKILGTENHKVACCYLTLSMTEGVF